MTKSELVQRFAEANRHLGTRDAEIAVNAIFDVMAASLARGDRVEVRRFGTFSVKKRDARIGRNPRTGNNVSVGEKHHPFFRTSKLFHDRLQKALKERGVAQFALHACSILAPLWSPHSAGSPFRLPG
jgi:integration host factor subunit beta